MGRAYRFRTWHLAALLTATAAVGLAAATAHRERYARARKLGVSVVALTNPERLLKRLRIAGGL